MHRLRLATLNIPSLSSLVNASPSHPLDAIKNGGRGRYPTGTFEGPLLYI